MLFANCTEVGIDPPAVEPCPECISGEKGLVQNEKSNTLTNFFKYLLCSLPKDQIAQNTIISYVFQPQVSCKRMPRGIQVQGCFCRLLCHRHTWGMHYKVQWCGGLSMVHPRKGKRSLHSLWGVQWPVWLRDLCKWREEMCPWIQRLIIIHHNFKNN